MTAADEYVKQEPNWFKGFRVVAAMSAQLREQGVPEEFTKPSPELMSRFESEPAELRFALYLWSTEAEKRYWDVEPVMDCWQFTGLTESLCAFAERHGFALERMWNFWRATTITANSIAEGETWARHSPEVDRLYEHAEYDVARLRRLQERLAREVAGRTDPMEPLGFTNEVQTVNGPDAFLVGYSDLTDVLYDVIPTGVMVSDDRSDMSIFTMAVTTEHSFPSPCITPEHSDHFRSVNWCGVEYHFTVSQAECVRKLWKAWERGGRELHQNQLMFQRDAYCDRRLRNVFRSNGKNHPAWGTMIVSGSTRGTFKLSYPSCSSAT